MRELSDLKNVRRFLVIRGVAQRIQKNMTVLQQKQNAEWNP